MRDYYYILGVAENAPLDQIKSAFRKLSMKFHPDRNNGDKFYHDQFVAILEAWDVLSDPATRARYDQQLRRFRSAAAEAAYKDALIRKYEEEIRQYKTTAPPPPQSRSFFSNINTNLPIIPMIIATCAVVVIITVSIVERWERNQPVTLPVEVINQLAERIPQDNTKPAPPIPEASADIVLHFDNGKNISVRQYFEEEVHARGQYRNYDPDQDGRPELQISYHTNGQECCNIDHLFSKNAAGDMVQTFSYMGGMYISGTKLTLYFYQELGFYHSCYKCDVMNRLPEKEVNAEIGLRYEKGKILPQPVDEVLNEKITNNLAFLVKKGIPPLDADGLDNGSRKAIMIHMMAYHFNNNQQWKTRELFDQYYTWSDRADRWIDLQAMISRYEEIIYKNEAWRKKQAL